MYHQIDATPPRGTPMRGMVVSPATFASHMRWLRLLGYQGLSMGEILPYLRGQCQGKVVGITFDDGYRNNLELALPILLRYGHRATVYAVSRRLGQDNAWDAGLAVPRKALMAATDLRTWVYAGMEVGAHTCTHEDLSQLSATLAREQIEACKAELEDVIGREVLHFCYPYGRYTEAHVEMVQRAGYLSATTVARGRVKSGDDFYRLPRVLIARSTHAGYFLSKLLTGYEDRYRS